MIRVALTGGIGTGKSTTLALFAAQGIKTLSADVVVHQLLRKEGAAFEAVSNVFPEAVSADGIDRQRLGASVFGKPEKLAQLEAILHPLVKAEELAFLESAAAAGETMAVVEIPLLFETGAEKRFDKVVVTHAPAWQKWQRVKAREGMTREKYNAITARQLSDEEKYKRADSVVYTGFGKAAAKWQVARIIRKFST